MPATFALTNAPVSVGLTIFGTTTPATVFANSTSVELGVKFRSEVGGNVTGVRFLQGVGRQHVSRRNAVVRSRNSPRDRRIHWRDDKRMANAKFPNARCNQRKYNVCRLVSHVGRLLSNDKRFPEWSGPIAAPCSERWR